MGLCFDKSDKKGAETKKESAVVPISQDKAASKKVDVKSITPNKEIGHALRDIPVFQRLSSKDRAWVGGALSTRNLEDGEQVFKQGDPGKAFYIIQSGSIRIDVTLDGKTSEVATLKDGDYFGEASLIGDAKTRGASATCVSSAKLWVLDEATFDAFFNDGAIKVNFASRRIGISAEQMAAGSKADHKTGETCEKDVEVERMLLDVVNDSLLFATLDRKHKLEVIKYMYRMEVNPDVSPVKQGDPGLNFYVIESGLFKVYKLYEEENEPVFLTNLGPGTSFGELALMYDAPRAATVTAAEESVVWVLDRNTFRHIQQDIGRAQVDQYVAFTEKVELLDPLSTDERHHIAEAFEEIFMDSGTVIMTEGDEGDAMYIVKEGKVDVTKGGEVVNSLAPGDYFGERALLNNAARAATVTSKTDVCLLKLDRSAFSLLLGPLESIMKKKASEQDIKPADTPVQAKSELDRSIKLANLKILGVLGKGSFGFVQLVQDKTTKKTYALKAISKAQIVQTRQQGHIMSEKKAMMVMNHPFIIRLFNTFNEENLLYFLLEPILGGELFTILRKRRLFPEHTAKFFAGQVILGFQYIHGLNFIYRDLKPENLLVAKDGYLKITDFGFAKEVKTKTWTLCGTPEYLAPEIVAGKGHGRGVDWWCVGVLIYEMLASWSPFYHDDHMKMYAKIAKGHVRYPNHFGKDSVSIISMLLEVNPTKRLGVTLGGAENIKNHEWFNEFDWEGLLAKKLKAPILPKVSGTTDLSNFNDYGVKHHVKKYTDDGTGWDADF